MRFTGPGATTGVTKSRAAQQFSQLLETSLHFLPSWVATVAELATLDGILGSEAFAEVCRREEGVALAEVLVLGAGVVAREVGEAVERPRNGAVAVARVALRLLELPNPEGPT